MGTNYYVEQAPCGECGHASEGQHLGKLSAGWLPAIPFDNVEDWKSAVYNAPAVVDEYGTRMSPYEAMARFYAHAAQTKNRRWAGDYQVTRIELRVDCLGEGKEFC